MTIYYCIIPKGELTSEMLGHTLNGTQDNCRTNDDGSKLIVKYADDGEGKPPCLIHYKSYTISELRTTMETATWTDPAVTTDIERLGRTLTRATEDVTSTGYADITTVTVTTSATTIPIPDCSSHIHLKHKSAGVTIWLSVSSSLTADGDNVWPLDTNEVLDLAIPSGGPVDLYAIVSSGTAKLYIIGEEVAS